MELKFLVADLKNKFKKVEDLFYFSTLLVIFAIIGFALFSHQGSILIDCGREAYIPEQILKGEVLYKDIFILYGPLSYQVNAFLYNLFGIHLNTLYFAGIANSLTILTVFYLIARKITTPKSSWLACFLLMVSCIFYYHASSYIFPYAYAMIYALSSFLISVVLCLYYFDKSKPVFLILSALFMGISFACKLDFAPFTAILFLIAIYFKPISKKDLALFTGGFLLIPALSWGLLFLKGLQISDITNHLQLMNEFIHSPLSKLFYTENTGLLPTHKFLWALKETAGIFFFNFAVCIAVFYAFFFAFAKLPKFRGKTALQVFAFIVLYLVFPKTFFQNMGETTSIGWIAAGTAIIFAITTIHLFIQNRQVCHSEGVKRLKNPLAEKHPTGGDLCYAQDDALKDKYLLLVAVAGILAAGKSFFFIHLQVFGTYLIPLLLLTCVVFLFDKIPCYLKFLNEKAWKQACFMVLFLTGIVYLLFNLHFGLEGNNYPVETNKGRIHTADFWGASIEELVTYIDKTSSDSTFMMLPEGLMINFLTSRDSNNRFYSLTPNFTEAFEDKIIQDMNAKKPDYIFITNQDTEDYGFKHFGKDYGMEIYDYVKNNYTFRQRIETSYPQENALKIDIYRVKP